jgi:hypothetical protein
MHCRQTYTASCTVHCKICVLVCESSAGSDGCILRVSFFQDPGPDILVCDEAHMIKNNKADITQALRLVRTHRRIALTGSPLQNNLQEYYCVSVANLSVNSFFV